MLKDQALKSLWLQASYPLETEHAGAGDQPMSARSDAL
jgi:hypothetical protein